MGVNFTFALIFTFAILLISSCTNFISLGTEAAKKTTFTSGKFSPEPELSFVELSLIELHAESKVTSKLESY